MCFLSFTLGAKHGLAPGAAWLDGLQLCQIKDPANKNGGTIACCNSPRLLKSEWFVVRVFVRARCETGRAFKATKQEGSTGRERFSAYAAESSDASRVPKEPATVKEKMLSDRFQYFVPYG